MDIQKKIEDYLNEGLVEERKAQVYIDKFEQAVSSFKKNLKAMKSLLIFLLILKKDWLMLLIYFKLKKWIDILN